MTVQMLELSNWVCWPEGIGWANQDYYLIGDVMTYIRLRRRVEWEVEHGITGEIQEQRTGDNPVLRMDNL